MKKVLSFAVVAALFSVAVSCSHDNYVDTTGTLLAQQKIVIDSFVNANQLPLVPDTVSGATNVVFNLQLGDTSRHITNDSSVVSFTLNGVLLNNQVFSAPDSIIKFNFINPSQNNSVTANNLVFSSNSILYYYLTKIGVGGHVTLITPSVWQYGASALAIGNVTIPANSPVYLDLHVVDISKP